MSLTPRGMSIQEAYRLFRDDSFIVNRKYQRKLVWTVEEKEFLVDSILNGLPIPLILLAQIGDKKFEIVDGREKFMFFLINALKNKMQEEELVSRICSWYFYSSGTKLTERDIRAKVRYHITRNVNYSFGMHYFKSLMKDYDVKRKE